MLNEKYYIIIKKFLCLVTIILLITIVFTPLTYGYRLENESTKIEKNMLYVGGDGPGNYTSIQHAVNDANWGDTVFVYEGTYYENIVIEKSINVIGEDRNSTIVEGRTDPWDHVFHLECNDIVIKGFTIKKGTAGLYIGQTDSANINIKVIDCNILNNAQEYGGICFRGHLYQLEIENCYFKNNGRVALRIESQGMHDTKILNCSFDNKDEIIGYNIENLTFNNCDFYGSELSFDYPSDYLKFYNCKFNKTNEIYISIRGSYQIFENCSFANCSIEAIRLYDSKGAVIRDCVFRSYPNQYYREAHGLSLFANNLLVENCIFSNMNIGIYIWYSHKNITVRNCHFENNRVGIQYMNRVFGNRYINNNFITNDIQFKNEDAWFIINQFKGNYWSDWRGWGPYHVCGIFNWDWHPSKEQYDIGV